MALGVVVASAFDELQQISFKNIQRQVASVFFSESITEDKLKKVYSGALRGEGKVKILIVPGHDDSAGGTEFSGIREADMNLAVGEALRSAFSKNGAYEATLLRDGRGYLPAFERYFGEHQDEVRAEVSEKKKMMNDLIAAGSVERADGVMHNSAAPEIALRLYTINLWANENGFHIVLHLHFNDFAGRNARNINRYNGFALYVPEVQYSNAKASRAVAEALFAQFSNLSAPSNLPVEDRGIVPDQNLIAVGAHNTLEAASILIEYAYIYETVLRHRATRESMLREFAQQTFLGINRFFTSDVRADAFDSSLLPYKFTESLLPDSRGAPVLSLQAALLADGVYPPRGKDLRDCPLSGKFGSCTRAALMAFQEKHDISPASGIVGPQTLSKLKALYGRSYQ